MKTTNHNQGEVRFHDNTSVVSITVRLFGTARKVSGISKIDLDLPDDTTEADLIWLLGYEIPSLVGPVISPESRLLNPSHTLNLNGVMFVEDNLSLVTGDEILLFSSQAGG